MKNCIFWSVYGDNRYLEIAKLSVDSFLKFNSNIDLLVYTDNDHIFSAFSNKVRVEKIDFVGGQSQKMAKRFDIASSLLEEYDNVLHVDTDVLAIAPFSHIFEIDKSKINFASESPPKEYHDDIFEVGNGQDKSVGQYWAGPLLSEVEKKKFKDTPSICAGVWLSNKTHKVWLEEIYNDVINFEKAGFVGPCLDQHAVVRNLLLNQRWDLGLQRYVTHYGQRLNTINDFFNLKKSKNIIVHFAGGVQPSIKKIEMMKKTLEWNGM